MIGETRKQNRHFHCPNSAKKSACKKFRAIAQFSLIQFLAILLLGCFGHFGTFSQNPNRAPGEKITEAQKITSEDLLLMESVTEQAISPDGARVAWIKRAYTPGAELPSYTLFVTRLDESNTTQLTDFKNTSLAKVQWAYGGMAVAFMGNLPGEGGKSLNQVWQVDVHSSKLTQLTNAPQGVTDFDWGEAGTILYTATDPGNENEAAPEDDTIRVTENVETPVRLFSLDLASGRTRRVTENEDMIVSLSVSPNGRYVFIVRTRAASPNYYQDIPFLHYLLDLDQGTERLIFEGFKISDSSSWSADSQTLFATGLFTRNKYIYAFIRVLRTLDVPSGREQLVDLDWNRGLLYGTKIRSVRDGFLALLEDGCHPKLMRYVKSGKGYKRRMIKAEHQGNIFSMDIGADGMIICYEHSTSSRPTQFYVASVDGDEVLRPRAYTKLNPQFDGKVFSRAEAITWKGARGDIVEGMLYFPANYDPAKKYPLILRLHGGPTDCVRDRWSILGWLFPYPIITQKEAFVLDPNYHGSIGYGLEFARSIRDGKLYEYPIEDIQRGIAQLVKLGMVDENRLGTMGWSQGSMLSHALITRDQRFKAASCGAGGAEWISYWGLSYVGFSFCDYYLGGNPIDNPEIFKNPALAPFFDAKKVKTPTIMFTCERDVNVPAAMCWITYRGIKKYGNAPVELYVFPGEPHILQKLSHQRRKMVEEQNWFDRYLFLKK